MYIAQGLDRDEISVEMEDLAIHHRCHEGALDGYDTDDHGFRLRTWKV